VVLGYLTLIFAAIAKMNCWHDVYVCKYIILADIKIEEWWAFLACDEVVSNSLHQ